MGELGVELVLVPRGWDLGVSRPFIPSSREVGWLVELELSPECRLIEALEWLQPSCSVDEGTSGIGTLRVNVALQSVPIKWENPIEKRMHGSMKLFVPLMYNKRHKTLFHLCHCAA